MNKERIILRELAKQVKEITMDSRQDQYRKNWRNHNSFVRTRPLIYMRAYAFNEFFDHDKLKCQDPFLRHYEWAMHKTIFHSTLGDDLVLEPWLTVPAIFKKNNWGVHVGLGEKPEETGAAAYNPEIASEEDFCKLRSAGHEIDEQATKERLDKLHESVGDIIEVDLDRGSQYRMWSGDISTDIAKLRGLEQIMWDAYDRPEFLHKLLAFMRDTILDSHRKAEAAGDWSLSCNQNQAVPYAKELKQPKANTYGVKMKEIWGFIASQEYTTFGPDLYQDFLLKYQIPIAEEFGLLAYGCCEDLTLKIDHLRKIKNLRRIGISPFADVRKCAEQIGTDYILSWRPNPSSMISTGLDEGFVRSYMQEHFEIFKENNNYFDITLKDVETVNHQPQNIKRWVEIVNEEIDKAFG